MTVSLFISILVAGSILSGLLTQAIKVWYRNENKEAPPNIVALINAIVCGGGVTAVVYMLLAIPFTINNIILLVVLIFFSWLGSMVGYDKITQTVGQMAATLNRNKPKENTEDVNDEGGLQ